MQPLADIKKAMTQEFRKVRGKTLSEAYEKMRGLYGDQALVVGTHSVAADGVMGMLGQKEVEITVSVSMPRTKERAKSAIEKRYAANSSLPSGGAPGQASAEAPAAPSAPAEEQAPAPPQGEPPQAPAAEPKRDTATVEYFERLVREAQERMRKNKEAQTTPQESAPPPPGPASNIEPMPRRVQPQASPGQPAGATPPQAGHAFGPAPLHAQRPPAPQEPASPSGPVVPFPQRGAATQEQGDASSDADELRREIRQIRDMVQVLYAETPGAGLPAEFAPHYRALVNRGVSRKTAAGLVGSVLRGGEAEVLRDSRLFTERLRVEIRRRVSSTGGLRIEPGTRRVVALCGPSGVGKTTNLAKIAAHYSINELARVALVSADTYRIAAADQLRVYANIIGLPLRSVKEPREMAHALESFADYDLVLVDTAGSSHYNLEQLNELKGFVDAARPDETVLVMAAGTPVEDMRSLTTTFKCIEPNSLLFCKLDETRHYGGMLSILVESGLPLSYLSVGRNVPDDIRVATPGMVANLVLGGKESRG